MAFYSDEVLMLVLCSNSNTCYNKCVKRFFGYNKYDSATAVSMELKLPTADTVLHNCLKLAGIIIVTLLCL